MERTAQLLFASLMLCELCWRSPGINLDVNNYITYSGPEGSYFGFSVDFFQFENKSSVVVGAPRAHTNQPSVVEGGAVFLCPWSQKGGSCNQMTFDNKGDEVYSFSSLHINSVKSHQWFGASVRSWQKYILACAPLYHWNVIDWPEQSGSTPVGNCQILDVSTGKVVDYSPCKDTLVDKVYKDRKYYGDRRYCEAGFSSDITKDGRVLLGAPGGFYFQGQIIAANVSNIITSSQTTNPVRYIVGTSFSPEKGGYDVYQGYSVVTGEFTGDSTPDYVVGVPNDQNTAGSVRIYNGNSRGWLQLFHTFYGTQVTSYFGHAVAVTDINNDGLDDILIGAPLYMERQSSKQLHEVGQVLVYLQRERSSFNGKPDQKLTGIDVYGHFGSSVAALGDIDKDGYNDIAVGAPFSADRGKVFIFMGQADGLAPHYTQLLQSPFQALGAAFGFTLRGGTDIDANGYPDLIVGAWGESKVAVYRAQAVVRVKAHISLHPDFLNPDSKLCNLPTSHIVVSCFIITLCVSVSGHRIPEQIVVTSELQLDKMKQKMARRTFLLDSSLPQVHFPWPIQTQKGVACLNKTGYLRQESEFKDKLSPIFISLNFSLEESAAAVLHGQTTAMAQTRIILDCGDDNVCVPDLRLAVNTETNRLVIGEENPVLLVIEAKNWGEGSYETELHILPPGHAHYQGVLSDREAFTRLVCAQKKDNGTLVVVCDLGNPMKHDQKILAGLYFSVGNLEEVENYVSFQAQIKSKNILNPESNLVELQINVSAEATLEIRGGSSPVEYVLPIPNWKPKHPPETLEDIGPLVEHVYELRNYGPGTVNARLEVDFPTHHQSELLLYIFAEASVESLSCQVNSSHIDFYKLVKLVDPNSTTEVIHRINKREVEQPELQHRGTVHVNCSNNNMCEHFVCEALGLERSSSAVVKVMARLWVEAFLKQPYRNYVLPSKAHYKVLRMTSRIQPTVFPSGYSETQTAVVWRSPDGEKEVPMWWILVAVLSGIALLVLLSFIFWKIGFFKRKRPPTDDDETEELNAEQPQYAELPQSAENDFSQQRK